MLGWVWLAAAAAPWVDWLLLGGAGLLVLWAYGSWHYDAFARRGVAHARPALPFFGSTWRVFFGLAGPEELQRLYDLGGGHGVFGLFNFRKPVYVLRDPDLIRHVTIKDFDHFVNRSEMEGDGTAFQLKSLVVLKDQQWRDMRSTLSPAFTASKLKGMVPLIADCARQLVAHIEQNIEAGGGGSVELDAKDMFTRFTNDVIATTAFGVRCDSLRDPHNAFYENGRRITTIGLKEVALVVAFTVCPALLKAMGVTIFSKKAMDFFDRAVLDTIRERKEKGIVRPDMLQLLMEARDGRLKVDKEDENEVEKSKGQKKELSDEDITAQAVLFFFAGFETVSTALCFSVHALAAHPDAQARLQEEVDDVMVRTAHAPSYEDVHAMKYLDMVVNETLRLYPPTALVNRVCGAACALPAGGGTEVRLRPGDDLWILPYGLHRDARFWTRPDAFEPERFAARVPSAYLPFGMGPRMCIAQRFALLEVKVALVHLVARFHMRRPRPSPGPLKFAKGFAMAPADGHGTLFTLRAK